MVYGYPTGGCYVVCLGALKSGCVSCGSVVSSMGLSLARTSLYFREELCNCYIDLHKHGN